MDRLSTSPYNPHSLAGKFFRAQFDRGKRQLVEKRTGKGSLPEPQFAPVRSEAEQCSRTVVCLITSSSGQPTYCSLDRILFLHGAAHETQCFGGVRRSPCGPTGFLNSPREKREIFLQNSTLPFCPCPPTAAAPQPFPID